MHVEGQLLVQYLVLYLAKLIYVKLSFIPAHYGINRKVPMNAQVILFTFWKKFSLPCTTPKLSNEATDKHERDIFGKYANNEDALDIDSGDRTYCIKPIVLTKRTVIVVKVLTVHRNLGSDGGKAPQFRRGQSHKRPTAAIPNPKNSLSMGGLAKISGSTDVS